MIREEGLKVISTRREQQLQSQWRHMTLNNAQSCDCVFLRHDLIHSCTPLQSLLCIFFITYHRSSLRKTKTYVQHAAVIISHTHTETTSPYSEDSGNKNWRTNSWWYSQSCFSLFGWMSRREDWGSGSICPCIHFFATSGGAVGWGTTPQYVSRFLFFLSAFLSPGVRSSSNINISTSEFPWRWYAAGA